MPLESRLKPLIAELRPEREPTEVVQSRFRRPRRNPAFSTTSKLIVLRDDPESASTHRGNSHPQEPSQFIVQEFEHVDDQDAHDPTSPTSLTLSQVINNDVHESVLGTFERRSHFHNHAPTQYESPRPSEGLSADTPSFFKECFPDSATCAPGLAHDHLNTSRIDQQCEPGCEPTQAKPQAQEHAQTQEQARPPTQHMSPFIQVPSLSTASSSSLSADEATSPDHPKSLLPPTMSTSSSMSSLQSLSPVNESTQETSRGEPTLFATEVRVRGWHRVGALTRGWIMYDIQITGHSDTVLKISKRYSAFVSLHEQLAYERPSYARQLPNLPAQHVGLWQRYHPLFLEDRRRALQKWLQSTLLDERWGNARAYKNWVLER